MTSSSAPTINDGSTMPCPQAVDIVLPATVLSHEDKTSSPIQAVTIGTHATSKTSSTFKSSFPKHLASLLPISSLARRRYGYQWHLNPFRINNESPSPTKSSESSPDPIVNTMIGETGSSANEANLNDGIRKRAAEDDGDNDERRKKQRGQVNSDRKFACPFYKRNPRKYSKWTSCPGPGWDEVHRVKSHLYRRHELIQCPRCWTTHKNNKSLTAHIQRDPPCEIQQNLSLVNGVTPEQKEKLLSRKKKHSNMTDEEKWRHMYMILFPDDDEDSIPSPYYEESDGSELEGYARFFRQEMPRVARREFESLPDDGSQNRERLLSLSRLVETISNVQSRLLDAYQQSPTSVYEQQPQSTEVESRASGIETGTTPPASATLTALTPPPASDPVGNADGFAESLLSLDSEPRYFEVDSQELQRWRDGCVPPGDTVNYGEFVDN